ncbi:MAG: hypothetical protein A2Y13_08980 [Planctomycetes bacterium GWC2_45_44]|nr:MAG: hypothetical protein A2Y13_08980 [Planctomycetes bacterium GWC2_45_44]
MHLGDIDIRGEKQSVVFDGVSDFKFLGWAFSFPGEIKTKLPNRFVNLFVDLRFYLLESLICELCAFENNFVQLVEIVSVFCSDFFGEVVRLSIFANISLKLPLPEPLVSQFGVFIIYAKGESCLVYGENRSVSVEDSSTQCGQNFVCSRADFFELTLPYAAGIELNATKPDNANECKQTAKKGEDF